MRKTVTKQLQDLATKTGFEGRPRKRLIRALKREWNAIPRNERVHVDAFELLSRATRVQWQNPHAQKTEEA